MAVEKRMTVILLLNERMTATLGELAEFVEEARDYGIADDTDIATNGRGFASVSAPVE